jgi:hypothetical protein
LQKCITIAGMRICVEDKLKANKEAQVRGVCTCDEIVEVRAIKHDDRNYIGIYSDIKHKGWGDLGGLVSSGHGLWQDSRYIFGSFALIHKEKLITKDFSFKNKNLKGMKCKLLHHDDKRGQSFVEFDSNVGGGSADGLGKSGHCIALSSELLEDIVEQLENESTDEQLKSKSKGKKKVLDVVLEKKAEEIIEIEKSPTYTKELWATIDDPETIDPEPIAIKAKIATKKNALFPPIDGFDWEEAARQTWNKDNEEFKWVNNSVTHLILKNDN